ncbi:MAG TPA: universal stress protein [Roseiflexaceae bacterium]|nr:universal stress protein [Roseiflexaceae bacterium]
MDERILVALDGSALAEAVFPAVMRLARAEAFGVTLLHISTPAERSQSELWVAAAPSELRRQWEIEALTAMNNYLAAVAERFRAEDLDATTEVVAAPDAADAILDYVEQHPEIFLVAMSTHGRTGLSRLALGSVAMKVLHSATKPILMIRAV